MTILEEENKGHLEMRRLTERTYLIDMYGLGVAAYNTSGRNFVLLDCGIGLYDFDALCALAEREGMNIIAAIATHCHVDHVGCGKKLRERYGTKIYVPYAEAAICDTQYALQAALPYMNFEDAEKYFGNAHTPVDGFFRPEEQSITVDGAQFGLLATPGHSAGHTCIITPDGVMQMGDAVLGYEGLKNGKLPYSMNIKADITSKCLIRDTGCAFYIAAHRSEVFTDIGDLVEKNIEKLERVTDDVTALADAPMDLCRMIEALMDKYSMRGGDPIACCLIERNMRTFLDYAVETGRLRHVTEKGVVKYVRP